jgi:hypothetical protein
MKKLWTQLIILVMVALIVLPVSVTGQNTTNSTNVTTTTGTSAKTNETTQATPNVTVTALVNITETIPPATTASLSAATTVPVPATTLTTVIPTTTPAVTPAAVGNILVASSPMGASILIDGVYYGVTPGNMTGISAGDHIVRLTMSGYYDYEGTFSAVPGQVTNIFGTLPPLSGSSVQQSTTTTSSATPIAIPVVAVTVPPTQTSSAGIFDNPAVIAAIIGIITASIGAIATIFPHISKVKKDDTKKDDTKKDDTKEK